MIQLRCSGWGPEKAIQIVRELRERGYEHGKHFDFFYQPPIIDSYAYDEEANQDRYVDFRFYEESLASWFELKYR